MTLEGLMNDPDNQEWLKKERELLLKSPKFDLTEYLDEQEVKFKARQEAGTGGQYAKK